ncbi:MAG: hypothetical protein ACLRFE_04450 [Clostridia bacterium]
MKRNEIVHKMHDEIEKINLAIQQMQKIYDRSPNTSNAKEAEYAIHLLTLAKKDIQETLNAFDAEFEDPYIETFAV